MADPVTADAPVVGAITDSLASTGKYAMHGSAPVVGGITSSLTATDKYKVNANAPVVGAIATDYADTTSTNYPSHVDMINLNLYRTRNPYIRGVGMDNANLKSDRDINTYEWNDDL